MNSDFMSLLKDVVRRFAIYGEFERAEPIGAGHINETFRSQWNQAGTTVRYTHQRINERIFTHPCEVMENIERVTGHIAAKLAREEADDRSRRVLTVVPSREGKPWARDATGGWWRTYLFIEHTHTPDTVSSPEDARFLGKSIGLFQKQLADLGGPRLHETIPGFHDMEKRYKRFYDALAQDRCGRAQAAAPEIAFLRENETRGALLIRALRDGSVPERICHNDTKMNNILIDDEAAQGRGAHSAPVTCVVDLDTVMPGTSLFDVGDLIRTVTTRAQEDERDLRAVVFEPAFFEALLDGYLSQAADFLTPREEALLCEAGRSMTQIMALRFLTDYLEGDHYYHTARPGHNLDRCRNQIALIRSMDAGWERALTIAAALCSRHRPAQPF